MLVRVAQDHPHWLLNVELRPCDAQKRGAEPFWEQLHGRDWLYSSSRSFGAGNQFDLEAL